MTRKELKQLIRETVEEAKYGSVKNYVILNKDFVISPYITLKKGEKVDVYVTKDGRPYIYDNDNQTIAIPDGTYEWATEQGDLPDDVQKRFDSVKVILNRLIKNRQEYLEEAIPQKFVDGYVKEIQALLTTLKNTK